MQINKDNWWNELKVGQIFRHKFGGRVIVFVVTKLLKDKGRVYVITNDGGASSRYGYDFSNYEFLGQYPSWQEAVNSFEFNNLEVVL